MEQLNKLKPFFPFSFRVGDLTELIISLAIYLIGGAICGLIIGFLASIPIIGFLFGLVGGLLGLYSLIGIILSVLVYLKVVK